MSEEPIECIEFDGEEINLPFPIDSPEIRKLLEKEPSTPYQRYERNVDILMIIIKELCEHIRRGEDGGV